MSDFKAKMHKILTALLQKRRRLLLRGRRGRGKAGEKGKVRSGGSEGGKGKKEEGPGPQIFRPRTTPGYRSTQQQTRQSSPLLSIDGTD